MAERSVGSGRGTQGGQEEEQRQEPGSLGVRTEEAGAPSSQETTDVNCLVQENPGPESTERTPRPDGESAEQLLCPDAECLEEKPCPDPHTSESPTDRPECPGCQAPGARALPCGHRLCADCIRLCQGELGEDGCTVCYGSKLMGSVLHTLLEALFRDQPRRPGVPPGTGREDGVKAGTEPGAGARREADHEEEDTCAEHGELLTLFCLEEEELVCQECQEEEHDSHQCCCLQEAALDCKRELRSAIRSLQDQLTSLTSTRDTWQDMAAHIKSQSEHTEQVVREEFEKLHQYLRDEEASALASLKQEEEEKSHRMQEKIDRITEDISALAEALSHTEEALGLDDLCFLKNYKKTSEKARCRAEEPEHQTDALLDVAKHLGCLQHRVWDKMQTITHYIPVTLDPNTASVCLSVSADLASVSVCEEQPLPDNPERFVCLQSVLGSEGFTTGRHSWEVEVGDNSSWSLGVARENIPRKDWSLSPSGLGFASDPSRGLWTISLSAGDYRAAPGQSAPLKLRRRPRRVRLQLDWERGCLTFSDANDNSLIYRFKQQWSSALRPYVCTSCSKQPLRIATGRVIVTTE